MTCAVYFNLDGTLTRHDLDYEAIYRRAIAAADLDALEKEYETYTDRFFRYFQNGWTFPRRQAIRDVMADHDIPDTGRSDLFAGAWEDGEADAVTLRDGAREVLEQVAAHHQVGIATNGTGRLQRMKLDDLGIADLVTAAAVSSEVGTAKPHSEFFAAARAVIEADHHVVVSDELRRDILPAKRADFLTVWLSPEPGSPQVEELVDRRVATLADVPAAVDDLCGE